MIVRSTAGFAPSWKYSAQTMKATHSGRLKSPSHNPNGRLTTTVIELASQSGTRSTVGGAAPGAPSAGIGRPQHVATVDVDHGPGHPPTPVATQPRDRLGHVAGVADRGQRLPAEGDAACESGSLSLLGRAAQLGRDDARPDGVDPDPVSAEIER